MKLTKAELEVKLEKLKGLEKNLETRKRVVMESDPFYFYEASDGSITEEGLTLLNKYLKPIDIPEGQLDGQLDLHKSIADVRGASGGNRSGKSASCSVEGYILTTKEIPPSLKGIFPVDKIPDASYVRGRVVGVSNKTLLNTVLPTYQKWVPRKFLKNGSWSDSYSKAQEKLFLYKNGVPIGDIEFMTYQQDVENFQGPELHWIHYDEEPPQSIWKENLLRFATTDINILVAWTPTKGITWISEDVFNSDDYNAELFKLCSITNKHVRLDALEKILNDPTLSYDEIKMRLLGSVISLSGLVYGNLFNTKVHVIEPFKITRDYLIVRGVDPHTVTPSYCLEVAVDREDNQIIIGTYFKDEDTEVIKKDLADRMKPYRVGWTACDKAADSTIKVFGDRNIYLELSRGNNAIPALFLSERYPGSIKAGVDNIKKMLKVNERTNKPKLFIFNTKENKPIIKAMMGLERDTYQNVEKDGEKDDIKERKWHAHACLRYINQRPVRWIPPNMSAPEYIPDNEGIGY
jgi:phage terminase large subunit-like protein